MLPDEFPSFQVSVHSTYEKDIERSGGFSRQLAREKAERDVAAALPEGLETAGQWIFVLEETATGESIGYVWFAERDSNARNTKMLWILGLEVDERYRGRGIGREAMAFVEAEARARGLGRVELNVFGGNEAARGLYRALGYEEVAVWMGKDVA
jgi:ribosomal protein S18 acetylase RimI-like enzyme